MKTFNILLFLLTLSSSSLLGQSISGASSADINTTVTYSYNRGSGLGSVNWSVTKGTVLSTSNSGTTYYASIKWTQEGTGTVGLTFFGSPSQWPSTKNVTISVPVVTPNTPNIQSQNCGNTVLSRSGNPPSGTTWYWQGTNPNGTATLGSGSTYTATSNGTYYIRAYKNGTWSPAAGRSVTVKVKPSTPSAPSISKNCGNTVATRSSPPSGVTWYWQTSSSGTSTSNSSSTYTRTSNGTVYLRARHNSSGCWSASRTVGFSVNSKPGTPSTPSIAKNCGNTVLTRSSHPSGITLYWQMSSSGTSTSNSSSTYTRTSNGTVYLRARNNSTQCWSSSRSVSVSVNAKPPTPSTPSVTQNCGNTVLTRGSHPSGITWYWQTSSSGTSTSNSSSTYTRTSNGTVYLRARNNSTGCWGTARAKSVTIKVKPPTPSSPIIDKNCGNTILNRASPPSGITWYWQTSSSGTSTSNSSASYTRTSNGTVYLRARNNSTQCWGNSRSISVSVNQKPGTPSTPSIAKNCGNTVLTRGSHPSGITWYWQTSSSGTSTSNSSSTYTRTSNGTVYLRARNNSTQCWGNSRSVSVSVNAKPPTPSTPSVTQNCGNTVLTRGSHPSGITWYWQTSSSGTSTSNSSSTYTRTSNGTVYLRARNNSTGCWGTARAKSVTVKVKPPTPSSPIIDKNCGNTILNRASPPSGITWYWQTSSSGTSTSNSSASYTRTSNGTVYLRARNNSTGCWGTSRSILVSVNQKPGIPSTPSIAKNCGNTVLTRGSNPSGITWYWQTSSSGTSTSNSSSTYTRTSNGTVYLRARNNSTQCWGTARSVSVSVNQKPGTPSTPSIAKNCGNTVLTRGAHPGGITWYWQTSSSGTSTSNSSSTYTRTSNGTVYLRARNNSTQCWGTARSVSVSVNALPPKPSTPSSTQNCGSTVLTRGAHPSGITWYWQASSSGTSTSNSSSTYTRTSNGTVYLRARNNSTQCWGIARSVSVSIAPIPPALGMPAIAENCGNTVLTMDTSVPSAMSFYWQTSETGQQTATINANASYTMQSSGTIYLRAKDNSGCWGTARAINVTVKQVPPMPSNPIIDNDCGNTALTRIAPPSNETWYWQTTINGTNTAAVNANATYNMGTSGTIYLRSKNDNNCWSAARSIPISVTELPNMPGSPTVTQNCGTAIVSRGTAASGETWYWQTSLEGTSTSAVNTNASYTMNSAGTLYLRAKNNTTQCWSPARTVSVSIDDLPAIPAEPSSTQSCGSTVLTMDTSTPSAHSFFWQTNENGQNTDPINANPSYTVSVDGTTIYLRARNSSGCWGTARSINVAVNEEPSTPPSPIVYPDCGSTTLVRTDAPSGETWYWQTSESGTSTAAVNADPNYSVSSSGTLYLRAKSDNGCWGSARAIPLTVTSLPDMPSAAFPTQECGTTTLQRGASPSGETWYWQTTVDGESIANSGTTIPVTTDGDMYLRAKDDVTDCWGPARLINVDVLELPSTPPAPSIVQHCGSTVLTKGTAPAGETWYWQVGEFSEATTNANDNFTFNNTGFIYLRSLSDNGCWGVSQLVNVSVQQEPAAPTTADVSRCDSGPVSMDATPGAGGNVVRWYSAETGGTLLHSGTTFTTTISETTSFWVSTYNALTGCENDQRVEVIASNYPTSSAPSVTIPEIICAGYATTLQSNSDQTEWYDVSSGGNPVYVGRNWTTTFDANATYYVETGNTNGCSLREPVMITLGAPVGGDLSGESDHFESASGTLNLLNHEGPILKWQSRTDQTWTDISNTTTSHSYSDLSEPTYFRVAVGPCAIEYSNEFLVNVIDAPVISWGNSFQLRPGSAENATVNSGYENYEWKKDGITVQNGSGNEYVISSPGEYQVVVTTAANGTYNSEVVTFTSSLDVDRNTIISYTYLTPTDDVSLSPHDFNANEMRIDAQFFDGLGRPTQTVSLAQTPLGADLVVPMEYDAYGRQTKTYLPYADASEAFFKSNALNPDYTQSDQNLYYTGNVSSENSYAFSETLLEKSPLGRTEKQGAPGQAWQIGQAEEHVVQYDYGVAEADQIYNWDMETFMTDNNPPKYEANQLLKNRVTDEDGNVSISYANKLGQTILKESQVDDSSWAGTYYIYDKLGQLKVVLPPMATDNLETQFSGQTTVEKVAFLDRWAFQYGYDSRNRMLTKQVPGAEEVRMVYDQWDRLVLTQDGNQRLGDEWLFTSYDQLNRPVFTGILKDTRASVRTHAEMQAWIMGMADSQERSLTFSSGASNQEYTSNAFPFSQTDEDIKIENILTVTYYDHYDWNTSGLTFVDSSLNRMAKVKGQVTGSLTKIDDAGDTYIKSTSYYDEKYRPIQTQSTNHIGGKDVVTNYYDYIGQVEKTVSLHYQSSTTTDPLKVTRTFEYDFSGRLLQTWHQIGDDSDDNQLIVENNYNEHGELIEKKLHSGASDHAIEGEGFAQRVDFSYNRRGWLTSINDSGLTDGEGDLFGMELLYNDQDGTLGNTGLYNGNISVMQWSDYNSHTEDSRAYTYGYDRLNRLKTADHFKGATDVSAFDVSNLSYDLNGNILSLNRAKETGNNMDELAYDYTGNRLNYVADNSGDSLGFNNGTTGTSMDYAYDANGNMVEDKNKGIDSIYYNHLNLPTTVFLNTSDGAGRIEYLYDAAGIKLRQKVYEGDTLTKTTDYVGEYLYDNSELQLIQHEEGRIVPKGAIMISENDGSCIVDAPPYRSTTPSAEVQNGETYIKVVSDETGGYPGVWPINGQIPVEEGKTYRLSVKGYRETAHETLVFVQDDNANLVLFSNEGLPLGEENEGWVSFDIVAPAGATAFRVGVHWRLGVSIGDVFYVNEMKLELLEDLTYDYQYHLKDHLGNTRLTFSTTPEEYVTVEGMESDGSNGPESPTMFVNIPYRTDAVVNTTSGGDEVATLGAGSTGVMIFTSVQKGDQMNFEVQANYDEDQISNFNLSTILAGAVFDSYTNTPGALSELPTGAQTGVGSGVNSMVGAGEKATSDDAPLAYINYIYLKSDMTFHRAGYTQITTAANGPTAHEAVLLDVGTMEMDGYILAYLTNESNEAVNVNFDDFTINHTKTNVVQTDDYYPFGLTFNSSQRTASTAQNFKYNGFEEQKEWGVYDYLARHYDPAIGRFINVDPAADLMRRHSPYNYAFDNPIRYIDPDGMMPSEINGDCDTGDCPDEQQQEQTQETEQEPDQEERKGQGTKDHVQGQLDMFHKILDFLNSGEGEEQPGGTQGTGVDPGVDPTKSTTENQDGETDYTIPGAAPGKFEKGDLDGAEFIKRISNIPGIGNSSSSDENNNSNDNSSNESSEIPKTVKVTETGSSNRLIINKNGLFTRRYYRLTKSDSSRSDSSALVPLKYNPIGGN